MITISNNKWSKLLGAACFTLFVSAAHAQEVASPNGRISAQAEGSTLVISYEGKKALQMGDLSVASRTTIAC